MPGFIDPHIHYPQTQVIASYGAQLLEWLEKYTFAEETEIRRSAHAAAHRRLLPRRAGRATAPPPRSPIAARIRARRMLCLPRPRRAEMRHDRRQCDDGPQRPAGAVATRPRARLSPTAKALIKRWHGKGRQRYAVTPRFAITSTEEQLEAAGALLARVSGPAMQTHLAENPAEIAPSRSSFRAARELHRRLRPLRPARRHARCSATASTLGHETKSPCCATAGAVAVFCPTSNLFLGSRAVRL